MLHVDEVIGQGGFGTVYRGRLETNDGLKRQVAIKVLSERMSQDSAAVARLRDEGRLLALIDHPAIVPVYAIQRVADRWAVVMGYVRGVELFEILRDGPLPERAVAEVGIAVASALADIWDHRHPETGDPLHVVHRDIKPQNLMVDSAGRVRILDFGIARAEFEAREAATMDGVAGTVAYMAPERWTKGGGGHASDVYALGVTMLELLTARIPERAGADQESHAEWLREAARRLSVAGAAADLWVVLGGMLAFDAADRPTAREVGGQLRGVVPRTSGDGVEAIAAARVDAALTRRAVARMKDTTLLGSHPTMLGEEDDSTLPDGVLASGWLFRPGDTIQPEAFEARSDYRPRLRSLVLPLVALVLIVPSTVLVAFSVLAGGVGRIAWPQAQERPAGVPEVIVLAPTASPEASIKSMEPIRAYLEETLDRPFDLVVANGFEDATDRLVDGEVSIAVLPHGITSEALERQPDLKIIATKEMDGSSTTDGYLLVGRGAAFESVSDLAGATICYPDVKSSTGYKLPRLALQNAGIDPEVGVTWLASGSHDQVLNDLIAGKCDAGGTYSLNFQGAGQSGVEVARLRLLTVTGQVPHDHVVVHPSLDPEFTRVLTDALVAFDPMMEAGVHGVGDSLKLTGFVRGDGLTQH